MITTRLVEGDQGLIVHEVRGLPVFSFEHRPSLHIHTYFSDREALTLGYTIHEHCCHVCNESILIYADVAPLNESIVLLREDEISVLWIGFFAKHNNCAVPVGYEDEMHSARLTGQVDVFCPTSRKTVNAAADFRNFAREN